MTMMDHRLVRLRGDEDWSSIGADWESQLDILYSLSDVRDWTGPPNAIRSTRAERRFDWGASLYEVTKAEMLELTTPRGEADERSKKQRERLLALPDDGRYGIVWVECY